MLKPVWTLYDKPLLPAGIVEDFCVSVHGDRLKAWFTKGASFQDQRLYEQWMADPLTLIGEPVRAPSGDDTHTRIERGVPYPGTDGDWLLVSQVWPGLPKCGIWFHDLRGFGSVRSLVVEPKDGTLYSVAAANPCVRYDAEHDEFDILFEGRNEEVYWRLFHARWKPGSLAEVNPVPLLDGANPSFLERDGLLYVYYSRLTPAGWAAGFETCVMWQEL